jgi:DNA/RNA-binding domain of Phe-tRNA-synthetase-like protein
MLFTASAEWEKAYPGAAVGVLAVSHAANPRSHSELDKVKAEVEAELRARWSDRAALKADPVIAAYQAYYKKFKKTYHVMSQVESVALKGRTIPKVAALVEAMFAAELKNRLLTAGHDLDRLELPLRVEVAAGDETYVKLGGQDQVLKAGDMFIADRAGVVSSIIYGPDQRTAIGPNTTRAVFTIYAPAGVPAGALDAHLGDIESYARLISPGAATDLKKVFLAA